MTERSLDIRVIPNLEKITKQEREALQNMIYQECFRDEELSAESIVLIGEGFLLQDQDSGDIVSAFIVCSTRLQLDNNRIGWYLTDVCTRESERGQGFMKLLLNRAKQYWVEKGVEHVTLYVLKSKIAAAKLYADVGFEVIRPNVRLTLPKCSNKSFPAQVMRLYLRRKPERSSRTTEVRRVKAKEEEQSRSQSSHLHHNMESSKESLSVQYIPNVQLMLPKERTILTRQLFSGDACVSEAVQSDDPWHQGALFFVAEEHSILAALFATRASGELPGPVVHVLFNRCIPTNSGVRMAELTKQLLAVALPLLQQMTDAKRPLHLCVPRTASTTRSSRRVDKNNITRSVVEACGFHPAQSIYLPESQQWIDTFRLAVE